jgi:hypothetical protein
LRLQPPEKSAILDLDEMGPVSAKISQGSRLIDTTKRPAERATQELDYGRRGKGYVFGAQWETTGDCFTQCYSRRTKVNFLDFLCWVDAQLSTDLERVYAIMDTLDMHHSDDLLFFLWQHPRWEMISQPRYAASLNLIEPMPGKPYAPWPSKVTYLKRGKKSSMR